jgi:hypothetical protein
MFRSSLILTISHTLSLYVFQDFYNKTPRLDYGVPRIKFETYIVSSVAIIILYLTLNSMANMKSSFLKNVTQTLLRTLVLTSISSIVVLLM